MRRFHLLLCLTAVLSPWAKAGPVDLTALSSTGSLGDFAAYLLTHAYNGTNFTLNTDRGSLSAGGYEVGVFAPAALAQPNGPGLSVFNFSAFDIPQGYGLTLAGSAPAVILANGSMQIAGTVVVGSNAGGGGQGGSSYFSSNPAFAGGGATGGGAGASGPGYLGPDQYGTGGSGGGGGMVSRGGDGAPGSVYGGPAAGGLGGAQANLAIFAGGGGGCYNSCYDSGRQGGNAGGAAFFGTPLNFTVTATGGIFAIGQSGQPSASTDGSSGGGSGGYLWFGVDGVWTNNGSVSARGGSGGGGGNYGAGGYINIDPLAIVNNGLIDVSDGIGRVSGLVILDSPSVSGSGDVLGSIAPEPGTFAMLGEALAMGIWRRSGRRGHRS